MTTKDLTLLIKKGKYVELPCVVGELLYGIEKYSFGNFPRYKIVRLKVYAIEPFGKLDNGRVFNFSTIKDNNEENELYANYSFLDFGKIIFDTEERALLEIQRLNSLKISNEHTVSFGEGAKVRAERKGEKLSSLRVGDKVLIKFPNAKYYLSAQIKKNEEIGEYIYIKGNKIPMKDIIKNYESNLYKGENAMAQITRVNKSRKEQTCSKCKRL